MKTGLFQLVPHEHTAKVRPHRHTSYAGLTFVLLVVGVLLLGASWASEAAVPAVNPQSGSLGLTGTVSGPAPSTAAVIVTPRSHSSTNTGPVTVTGTCPLHTFVSITKNGVFAGIVPCQDDGTFSLQIDLFDGANSLVAQVTDALGQNGPDSTAVDMFYNAPSLAVPGSGQVGKQLFLETATTVVAGEPGAQVQRSVTIVGGVGPYAISWDWGDNQSDLQSQGGDGPVSAKHIYTRAGTYRVIVRVTDSQGNAAFMQLVTVVNGPADTVGASQGNGTGALSGTLLAAWPLFTLAGLMVLFFWMGERRQIAKSRRQRLAAEASGL